MNNTATKTFMDKSLVAFKRALAAYESQENAATVAALVELVKNEKQAFILPTKAKPKKLKLTEDNLSEFPYLDWENLGDNVFGTYGIEQIPLDEDVVLLVAEVGFVKGRKNHYATELACKKQLGKAVLCHKSHIL